MTGVVIYQQNAGSVILQHESHKLKGSTLGWVQVRDLPTIFLLKAGGGLGADLFASLVDKVFIDVGVARPFVLQVGGARGPVANSHPPRALCISGYRRSRHRLEDYRSDHRSSWREACHCNGGPKLLGGADQSSGRYATDWSATERTRHRLGSGRGGRTQGDRPSRRSDDDLERADRARIFRNPSEGRRAHSATTARTCSASNTRKSLNS